MIPSQDGIMGTLSEKTMADLISRRDLLLKNIFKTIFNHLSPEDSTPSEISREESLLQYFQSPLHSYPLLQEMPLDMLIAEAQVRGIPTDGRSKNEIARDIFLKIESVPR
jgi:hypothetical protein